MAVWWRNYNNTATNPAGGLDAREQSVDIFFQRALHADALLRDFNFSSVQQLDNI